MKQKASSLHDLEQAYATNTVAGLTEQEAQRRLSVYGPNALPESKRETWLIVFLRQFQNPLIYILVAAAILIFFVDESKVDAFIIFVVLFFNAIVGTVQEGRTRSMLQSLKQFALTSSIVLRDGEKVLLEDKFLVPGDIILLQEGQKVPADAYVLESNSLQLDEAMLTGESRSVYKAVFGSADAEKTLRADSLSKGTHVLSGSGKALVYATGANTQVGKINKDIESIDVDMPLKREMDKLAIWFIYGVLGICSIFFVLGFIGGQSLRELLVLLTALFISVVPEGLPIVLVLVLVTGIYRLAKENVLIKRLQAVEGLGRSDVIVTDKTGTLTRNELMVVALSTHQHKCDVTGQGYHPQGSVVCGNVKIDSKTDDNDLITMATAALLLNAAEVTHDTQKNLFEIKGDPTEAAMFIASQKIGCNIDELTKSFIKLFEIPFNPKRKYHAGYYQTGTSGICFVIGAPEVIFSFVSVSSYMQNELDRLLKKGLRVLAVASGPFDIEKLKQAKDAAGMFSAGEHILAGGSLKLHGYFAMQDTIRQEVPAMIQSAYDAGLQVVMATGDHKDTALQVAREIGILQDETDEVLTGCEFEEKTDEEMLSILERVKVYARFMPQQKMRLVQLFHKKNHIIAMTGDGVNDAPALVAADIGIAMGGIGSEVAKEAADVILFDDSFANIMHAIAQGRHIFYAIKRVVLYYFSTSMAEVLIVLFALIQTVFYGAFPIILTAPQILWINLVTDGFLDFAIAMEPEQGGLLHRRWLRKRQHIIDWIMVLKIILYALPMAIGSIWIFLRYYQTDLAYARTMALVALAMYQWFNAFNCRSITKSLFSIGLFRNLFLNYILVLVLGLQLLLVYVPFMNYAFKTVPLKLSDWFLIVAITLPIIVTDELRKCVMRYLQREKN